jgi:hypothetical protein
MEEQQQVVNLELSKRMKELGFKQESLFVWCEQPQTAFPKIMLIRDFEYQEGLTFAPAFRYSNGVSAYTVAELGEMLPHEVRIDDETYWHGMRTEKWEVGDGFVWRVIYENHKKEIFEQEADTEANARAKMLIYLKENNLL